MAKKYPAPAYDNPVPIDHAAMRESQPHGGYRGQGYETLDGLDDRGAQPYYTHRQDPAHSTNRTLLDGTNRKIGSCSPDEGVTFHEPLRTDLDSTFGNGH